MERPILFSGPMVLAILAGTKSQTRRLVKPVRGFEHNDICEIGMPHSVYPWAVWWHGPETDRVGCLQECPYGEPGQSLWVREAWAYWGPDVTRQESREFKGGGLGKGWEFALEMHRKRIIYRAEGDPDPVNGVHWRPSIYMPRWASRIDLTVTAVRVERVQDISEADARAEGCHATPSDDTPLGPGMFTAKLDYMMLWDEINGKRAPWASNPLVWVVEFEVKK